MSKTPEAPELVDIDTALKRFAFPNNITQSSDHIRRLHWYTACRLVIEGGFDPGRVVPRPPFKVVKRAKRTFLHHDPLEAKAGERTVLGGLKTKQVDVTVSLPGIGPVLAISLKGTHNAFRNLTNRMEEAAGDCTNLHMAYPALVYGFWHVLRANEESDPAPFAHFALGADGYKPADLALMRDGSLAEGVERYAHALDRLSDRDDLRDHPSRYEACGLTLVKVVGGPASCGIHPAFPSPDTVLDFNRLFRRLYTLYDQRFVHQAPSLASRTRRLEWDPESPVLRDTILSGGAFDEMQPRIG